MDSSGTGEKQSPFFSVCIPVYNGKHFIQKSIQSVLDQTFHNYEIIVVDDGSTDGTWELLQEYKGHRQIRLFQNGVNMGQGKTFNRFLELAQGSWMGLLAADDLYVPHALETVRSIVSKREDLLVWAHGHLCFGENINPNAPLPFSAKKEFNADEFAELLYLKGGVFGEISNFLFNISVYRKNPCFKFMEHIPDVDGQFWIQFMHANPAGHALFWPETLTHVYQHADSESSKKMRSGLTVTLIFTATEEAAGLGWSTKIQCRQIARMLWVWLKFYRQIPTASKFMAFRTVAVISKTLFDARKR